MAKTATERSEIVVTAEALDRALARYESLVAEAQRTPLESKKSIERAAKVTREAAQTGEEMGALVSALARAIQSMSARQETQSKALLERGREIQTRAGQLEGFATRFAELAAETTSINEGVQDFARASEGGDDAKMKFLKALRDRMTPVIEASRELAKGAQAASFLEIVKQADALSQTLASAKNKVELTAKRLGGTMPS
jgi:hypothetical protein